MASQPLFSGGFKARVTVNPETGKQGTRFFISCEKFDANVPLTFQFFDARGNQLGAINGVITDGKGSSNYSLTWQVNGAGPGQYAVAVSGLVDGKLRTVSKVFVISG